MNRNKSLSNIIGCVFFSLLPFFSFAQNWPQKPIHVIVSYPAGGVVDILTRTTMNKLAEEISQPIIVENKPGANSNIAAELVANSASDGYTLLVSAPYLINNPLQDNNLRWKPSDLIPVARFALSPSYVCIPGNSKINTLQEFVNYAKENPDLPYGDPGSGTTQSMASEMLAYEAGIKLKPILYKGAPPIITDLINGLLVMSVVPSTVAIPQVKAGKLKALANTSYKRSPDLPNVPTIAEAGYKSASVLSWYGLHAPANTPKAIISIISAKLEKALSSKEIKEKMALSGGEAAFLGEEQFKDFYKTDAERWTNFSKLLKKEN
jgi:tripartite-type tricarboxylate transporter receptor subunit TctC